MDKKRNHSMNMEQKWIVKKWLTINLTLTSCSCIPGDQTCGKKMPNENDKLP